MITRCKVICSYIQPQGDGVHLHFYPVVSGSEENKKFFKATPGGSFTFYTINQEAASKFEQGKEYYLDLSEV